MLTVDIPSLYTNIPHSEGIERVTCKYKNKFDKLIGIQTLSKVLDMSVRFNHFALRNTH